jgi:hypothetical protein
MPIVRITLPAEKRALREKMRALGLIEGIRRITSRQQPSYRCRIGPRRGPHRRDRDG